jgi:hypothetical protein
LLQCRILLSDPILQVGYSPSQSVRFLAQYELGASVEAVGDELRTVQSQSCNEESSLRCQAIHAAIFLFGDVQVQIVVKWMEQADVGRVDLVPVAPLVFVALGAAIDDVLVPMPTTARAWAVVIDG